MRFEQTDKRTAVILDEGETIEIATFPTETSVLTVKNTGSNLILTSGLSNPVKKERVEGFMTEEEIIKKCDEWLEVYKKTFDIFKKIVTSKIGLDKDLTLFLEAYSFCIPSDKEINGKSLSITIKLNNIPIVQGPKILISDENERIFFYLCTNALLYYIYQTYNGREIIMENNYELNFYCEPIAVVDSYELQPKSKSLIKAVSEYKPKFKTPMYVDFDGIRNKIYSNLFKNLIYANNNNLSFELIMASARNNVFSQKIISDVFENSIEFSKRQFECVSKLSLEGTELVRKL